MGIEIGTLHVRRCGFVDAPPARVWEELQSRERLAAWFGLGHSLERFDAKVGGEVLLSVEIDGRKQHFGGRLLVLDAERELTYESNWHGDDAWPLPTYHTIRLTPLFSGTLVEIFHHGFERLGEQAGQELQDYEAGWTNRHIVALREIVEGS